MSQQSTSIRQIIYDGVWANNAGLIQLLGLCPLMAVSNTFINGLGLGLATIFTLIISNTCISLMRKQIQREIRIPIFILIIASCVTAIELIVKAYFHELHLSLGIFLPLIVTNCMIIGRAEAFAYKNPVGLALLDGLCVGIGFAFVLICLGGLREIIGFGTLFSQSHVLFGQLITIEAINLSNHYRGFLIAILPPGAFIGLGLMVALKKTIDERNSSA